MRHPLDSVPGRRRRPAFLSFLVLTAGLFLILQSLDTLLKTQAAPAGIVSFELAGTEERAGRILSSWGALSEAAGMGMFQPARTAAAFSLGMDFLFMPCYALALSLGILLANPKAGWMGWLPFAAAGFDALENLALLQMLLGQVSATWAGAAAFCAWVKFGLLAVGLVYVVVQTPKVFLARSESR